MFIVLDTNIIKADQLLKKSGFQILLDYADRTDSRIALPKVVLDELEWNYRRDLTERINAVESSLRDLNRMSLIPRKWNRLTEPEEEARAYVEFVRNTLAVNEEVILIHDVAMLEDALQRAIARRRPCSKRGEEIRDAVIWNCVVRLVKDGTDVVFVSNNQAEFGTDGALHLELADELKGLPGSFNYVNSLDDFGKQHAHKIAFVTKEWIQSQIPAARILEAVEEAVVDEAKKQALRYGEFETQELGDFEFPKYDIEVSNHWVYEMRSGEKRLEIHWFGVVDVAYSAWIHNPTLLSSCSGSHRKVRG